MRCATMHRLALVGGPSSRTANSSPPSRATVSPARSAPQPPRDRDQQLVAARVAERVVDRLEAVEVDQQHADGGPRPRRALLGLAQAVGEQRAVGEVGQRVVERAVDGVGVVARVGQREARVLGERDQHLALVDAVAAAGLREATLSTPQTIRCGTPAR